MQERPHRHSGHKHSNRLTPCQLVCPTRPRPAAAGRALSCTRPATPAHTPGLRSVCTRSSSCMNWTLSSSCRAKSRTYDGQGQGQGQKHHLARVQCTRHTGESMRECIGAKARMGRARIFSACWPPPLAGRDACGWQQAACRHSWRHLAPWPAGRACSCSCEAGHTGMARAAQTPCTRGPCRHAGREGRMKHTRAHVSISTTRCGA